MKLTFGRWKGKEINDIPRGYLRWIWANARHACTQEEVEAIAIRLGKGLPESIEENVYEMIAEDEAKRQRQERNKILAYLEGEGGASGN